MRIHIVGSLEGYGIQAAKIAIEHGAHVITCTHIEECLKILRSGQSCDLILIDVCLDIKSLVEALKTERFHLEIVACGIKPDPKKAASAIRAGAKEYIPLPPDPEMIASLLQSLSPPATDALIANDPSIKNVIHLAQKVSPSHAHILLTGESGTGKEVLAHYIHQHSKRHNKPFIAINCAAIPENLLESELFGHEKGAFTGATTQRIGKFEAASGGTLLLDEITEMPLLMQAKLLRAIQEKTIDRVGGNQTVPVDIRIIATTNRDMHDCVQKKQFREDLYYRLNVVAISLPPLRKRPSDILPLAKHFISKYAVLNQVCEKDLSPLAEEALLSWKFQGNVRELENLMHRAVLLSDDTIQPEDIFGHEHAQTSTQILDDDAPIRLNGLIGKTLQDVEKEMILSTLNFCTGKKNSAAEILGISIRALENKLREYQQHI